MAILTKSDLVAEVATRTNCTKAATDRFITALQDVIMEAVSEGKDVKLTGFASFAPALRAARTMKNPQTGEDLSVPESKVVRIRPLSVFRAQVQGLGKN